MNGNITIAKRSIVGTGSGITMVPESTRHHEGYNSVKKLQLQAKLLVSGLVSCSVSRPAFLF
jgi:hypothetical protein